MTTVAVLSGRERRRRWTAAEKLRIVEESLAPAASVTEVARRHDVHPNLLHLWRRQARTGVLRGEPAGETAADGAVSFAAVTVAAAPGSASSVPPAAPGMIEIDFACGARLRITGAVEPATASAVVAAVAGTRR
jgi:transposase